MDRRLVFGVPSDVFPEEYPTHPSLVDLGYGEHSPRNPDYIRYAGLGDGVAYAQDMPASAQRDLVYNAAQDMEEAFERDGISKKRWPGAMGSYWAAGAVRRDVEEDEDEDAADDSVRRGHQIYLGSSLKEKQKGADEVVLEPSLYEQLAGEEDELRGHRMRYRCAEPGLISDHRYANAWDYAGDDAEDDEVEDHSDNDGDSGDEDRGDEAGGQGGRFYVEDAEGNYMPPCGHDKAYGCRDICVVTGDWDLGGRV
jgi:hypothetical protein